MRASALTFVLLSLVCVTLSASAAEMVLVEKGASLAPIILSGNPPPSTVQAAKDLAEYIEKISGAKPAVLTDVPDPVPPSAIWLGVPPDARTLFPGVSFDFAKPEEILIVCNGRHLAIAGRDRILGETQVEHGTANAAYTFIEKHLDVRWLWPGALGEDFTRRETISIAPVEYRFHPPFRQRAIFRRPRRAQEWCRFQRNALDSLQLSIGHGFSTWHEKYFKDHPDYFALQPDGTRGTYPDAKNVKMCESNPRLWAQWLDAVAEARQKTPAQTTFNASENDSASSGWCICDGCRAWDNPDAELWRYSWKGVAQEYLAMTDRNVNFWNHLGRGLKERFPGEDLYVLGMAYGPSRPAPVAAKLDSNVIIGFVGHFPLADDAGRLRDKENWKQWAAKAPALSFRPNLFWYSGGMAALPTVALKNTLEDFRFLAENKCVGLNIDTTHEHWGVQGPQYYVMAQLAWDPLQDGQALVADYYRRAFGPAAAEVKEYFGLMEQAHQRIVDTPGWRPSMGLRYKVLDDSRQIYAPEFLDQAGLVLRRAETKVTDGPEIYRQRVAFVGRGLEFVRMQMEIVHTMAKVRASEGKDAAAVNKAIALCAERDKFLKREENAYVINAYHVESYIRYRKMEHYLGPPSEAHRKAAGVK